MRPRKNDVIRHRTRSALFKAFIFFGVLIIASVIGHLWFARPDTSELEKRELTEFPKFSLSGIWDGSFFSGIETWYSDTYPLREKMIAADQRLDSMYGVRKEQIVAGGKVAEEIPEGPVDLEALANQDDPEPAPSNPGVITDQGGDNGADNGGADTAEDQGGNPGVETPAELTGTIYITENCGYGVYYYTQKMSARYCINVNSLGDACAGKANVYCIICPISAGIMLSESVQEQIGASNEDEAMTWMYEQMNANVIKVNPYKALRSHNDEYIYFHTDHHWTALGAYYAYCEFCKAKGIEPHSLSDFETMEFPNFLGTFYSSSNQSPALASNPDTVKAYVPNGTNKMEMYEPSGVSYQWRIVNDVSDYVKSELYAAFSGGDHPYNYAHNEAITDGSAVLIIKDSFGNALIPFLVDHYEHIYWIDYRYYSTFCANTGKASSAISALVAEKGINDVLVVNNINSTGAEGLLANMAEIYK